MTISGNSRHGAAVKGLVIFLALCLALLLSVPAALAAPEDGEEIEIDLTEEDQQEPETSAATRLVVNEDEELTDYTGGEDQAEEAAEEEREKTDTEPAAEMEEEGEPEETRNPGAFTVDGNGTIQDIIADGTKEFYVITTDNGGVFYLLIDRAGDIDNVYFLSAVDETDIQDFVKEPVSASVNEETGTATVAAAALSDENGTAETGTESAGQESSSSSSGSSYTGLIVLAVIVVAAVIIVLVRRSRRNRKNSGKQEEGSEEADPQEYLHDPDEEDDEDI